MSEDARFEDGVDRPLYLKALESDDLPILSALIQDAVFLGNEITFQARQRRFAILLNRFRWEDIRGTSNDPERVRSVLVISDVLRVQSQGVTRDASTVLSALSMQFAAAQDGMGRIEIMLAGDGAIGLDVEALDVTLRDVTRPYNAVSGKSPKHPE